MANATSMSVKKSKASNFDSSSDSEDTKTNKQSTSAAAVPNRSANNNNCLSNGAGAASSSTTATQRHHHQHIPFPTTKAPIYSNLHSKPPSCSGGGGNTCYLSVAHHHKTAPYTGINGDEPLSGGSVLVPTLGALRARAPPPTPSSNNIGTPPPYIHYSAFHVYTPSLGNGTHDYTSTSQSGGEVVGGGCPFITCAKCDHPVVRLQGARWVGSSSAATVTDGSPSTPEDPDLYLTVRNLYPDWGRLATCRIRDYSAAAYTTTTTKNTNINNGAALSRNGGKKVVVDDFDDSDDDVGKAAPAASAVATSATSRGSGAHVDSFDDDDDEVVMPPKPQQHHHHHSSSTSTNCENDGDNPHVLVEDVNAAAYCCQCSWFSVITIGSIGSSVSTPIHTTMSDITLKKHAPEFTSPTGGFITMSVNGKIATNTSASSSSYKVDSSGAGDENAKNAMRLLCNPHGRIRAPLWVCKGHL